MSASSIMTAAAAFALLLGGSAMSGPAGTHVVSRGDVLVLKERMHSDRGTRDVAVDSAKRLLARQHDEATVASMGEAIRKRMRRELEQFIDSMRGRRVVSLEAVHEAVERQERILCYDAVTWPEGFANGSALVFVVDHEDAEALKGRISSLVVDREVPLRDAVRERVLQREMTLAGSRALRDFARARATSRGRDAIDAARGGSFFSKLDFEQFVENEIVAELDEILRRVRDDSLRRDLLEEVMQRSGS